MSDETALVVNPVITPKHKSIAESFVDLIRDLLGQEYEIGSYSVNTSSYSSSENLTLRFKSGPTVSIALIK